MSRPRALAVFMLMISSTLSGVLTGSSLGFLPLRMRFALEFFRPARLYALIEEAENAIIRE